MTGGLRIEFDRQDRVYATGELLRGWVTLDGEDARDCRGIRLTRSWRTHGKGNPDEGDPLETELVAGPLEGPGPHRIPFEVETPPGPFTYRGEHLNVDHYVRATADLPLAFDPAVEEDFILLPGPGVGPPHPDLYRVRAAGGTMAPGCRRVLGLLFVLVGLVTIPFGLVFIVAGAFVMVPGLWKKIAGLRVGDVSADLDRRLVTPGGAARLEVRIRPAREARVDAVTAVLRGREVCVSGHGTDRTTHTHVFHERSIRLSGPAVLSPGRTVEMDAAVPVPQDAPWSFSGSDNDVLWDVVVHVDVPSWPDWKQALPIVVWPEPGPRRITGEEQDLPPLPGPDVPSAPEPDVPPLPGPDVPSPPEPDVPSPPEPDVPSPPDPDVPSPPEPDVPPVPDRPAPPAPDPPAPPDRPAPPLPGPAPSPRPAARGRASAPEPSRLEAPTSAAPAEPAASPSAGLVGAVRAILAEPVVGGRLRERVEALVGSRQSVELEVERVERSFGVWDDPDYRDGRTVLGTVAGTDVGLAVRFPPAMNEEVDRLRRGDRRPVEGTVADWDRLARRPLLKA